jgi:hypothetical protein
MARNAAIIPGFRTRRFPTLPVTTGFAVDRRGNPITVRGARSFGAACDSIDAAGIAAKKGITVGIDGEENLLYGENLSEGDELTPGADSKWYHAASGEVVGAYCTFTGVAGQLGTGLLLSSGYIKP